MKIFAACGLLTLSLASCKDEFFDVNENPNNPSVSTPRLSLPVAQQEIASLNARTMTYLGQYMMYNWAKPSNWSANSDFLRYNVTSNFGAFIFENSYSGAFKNLTYIENYKDPGGTSDYTLYKGISTVLKAFQYQYLVDLYGDVPYTEANMRGDLQAPKYDKAEDIYKANIDSLTQVISVLDNLPENTENPGTQDIIFQGDVLKWQQFANTVKLRYLIRLSNTGQDSYIKSEIAKIKANGKGFISADVAANPGYSDTADKINPFYDYFRKPSTGAETDRADYTVATDYTIDYLEKVNDPRLTRLYSEAANGGYKGVYQSTDLPGEGYTSKDLSKVGPGLLKSPDQDQPIMLLSEALFLQSEAIVRGYLTGDAESLYNMAITESFRYLEVEDYQAAAEDYYTQNIPNVSFADTANKIQAIITQKWIALNGTSSIELWLEYNRTGYPAGIPLSKDASRGQRPYRLLYPASEISRNANNVPKQVAADAFSTKIFWQK